MRSARVSSKEPSDADLTREAVSSAEQAFSEFGMTPEEFDTYIRSRGRLPIRDPEGKEHYRLVRDDRARGRGRLNDFLQRYPWYRLLSFEEVKRKFPSLHAVDAGGFAGFGEDLVLAACPRALHERRQKLVGEIIPNELLGKFMEEGQEAAKEERARLKGRTRPDDFEPFILPEHGTKTYSGPADAAAFQAELQKMGVSPPKEE